MTSQVLTLEKYNFSREKYQFWLDGLYHITNNLMMVQSDHWISPDRCFTLFLLLADRHIFNRHLWRHLVYRLWVVNMFFFQKPSDSHGIWLGKKMWVVFLVRENVVSNSPSFYFGLRGDLWYTKFTCSLWLQLMDFLGGAVCDACRCASQWHCAGSIAAKHACTRPRIHAISVFNVKFSCTLFIMQLLRFSTIKNYSRMTMTRYTNNQRLSNFWVPWTVCREDMTGIQLAPRQYVAIGPPLSHIHEKTKNSWRGIRKRNNGRLCAERIDAVCKGKTSLSKL